MHPNGHPLGPLVICPLFVVPFETLGLGVDWVSHYVGEPQAACDAGEDARAACSKMPATGSVVHLGERLAG